MARLIVVSHDPTAELPSAFALVPHTRCDVESDSSALREADVVLVDGRRDLAGARDLCLRIQGRDVEAPIMMLVGAEALAVLSPQWGIADFVMDQAGAAEIDARVRLLTHVGQGSNRIVCGPVEVDETAYTATVGGRPLELTYTEFELLKYLALHPNRVLSRETLLSEVWGYDYYGGTRTVDVHIRRLRAKLGAEYDGHITTVRNVGYRFAASR
ncbi:DNA-binding response OmpR family regulator [Luteococcus japonicus]|uniref:DNA-binding response OmpR family regulator n=1 Tax=Luteococcus japonicus TaxID=33984 RepID=A0A3N1ZTS3_9ACTN|nr:response regulator transcription factor [Luteococcus japonicus]ROR54250.1 DNA-binding response OmpR family regulator [Luteococcus japonicus]